MTAEQGRDLPEGWIEATIPEVTENLDRLRIPVSSKERAFRNGPYAYYGANGQVGNIDSYLFEGEHILVAEDGGYFGEPGKSVAYRVNGQFWVNNHAHVLQPVDQIEGRYVTHALNRVPWMKHVSGSTRLKLTQGQLNTVHIPLPPLAEQRRIVEKIEALTARSRRARAALEALPTLLDRYRASVLAAAFRGDLTKDWRAEHGASQADLRAAFDLGCDAAPDAAEAPVHLPQGWGWARLEEIADVKGGLAKGKKRRSGAVLEAVPYLRVANVQRGFIDLSEVKEIPATAEEIDALALQQGDILFNEGGDRDKLGRGWVWEGQIDRCIHQNHVFRARLRVEGLNPYLLSMYGNAFGQAYFFGAGTQSVNLASISLSKLRAFPVPLIPEAEQAVLLERLNRALAWADALRARLADATDRLSTLDQSILAKAFRGELVPQDPTDEPPSVLLDRIRARRAAEGAAPKRGRRKTA